MSPSIRLIAVLALLTAGLAPAAATADPADEAGTVLLAQADVLPENYAASVEVRLSQMESQIRDLTGQVEELQYELRRVTGQLQRSMADVEFRLNTLEGGDDAVAGGPTVSAAPQPARTGSAVGTAADIEPGPRLQSSTLQAPSASIGPTYDSLASGTALEQPGPVGSLGTLTVPGDGTDARALGGAGAGQPLPQAATLTVGGPMDLFDHAYRRLQTSDYQGAEQAFRQLVDQYPEHEMVSQARYWLGETFYMRGRFDEAARTYAESYRGDPGGPKAVDSLLKLGMSLAATGQRGDACRTFAELYAEFPSAPTSIRRRADQERARLQCP